MKKCSICSCVLEVEAEFCEQCGTKVEAPTLEEKDAVILKAKKSSSVVLNGVLVLSVVALGTTIFYRFQPIESSDALQGYKAELVSIQEENKNLELQQIALTEEANAAKALEKAQAEEISKLESELKTKTEQNNSYLSLKNIEYEKTGWEITAGRMKSLNSDREAIIKSRQITTTGLTDPNLLEDEEYLERELETWQRIRDEHPMIYMIVTEPVESYYEYLEEGEKFKPR